MICISLFVSGPQGPAGYDVLSVPPFQRAWM